MRIFVISAALSLVIAPLPALAAAPGACLSHEEVNGLVRFAMPDVVGKIVDTCAGPLGATSYIGKTGPALTSRFTSIGHDALPLARAAFAKISGIKSAAGLSETTLRELLRAGMIEALTKVKPEDCKLVDKLLAPLDPLPASNMAGLVAAFMEIGAAKSAKAGPIALCPDK